MTTHFSKLVGTLNVIQLSYTNHAYMYMPRDYQTRMRYKYYTSIYLANQLEIDHAKCTCNIFKNDFHNFFCALAKNIRLNSFRQGTNGQVSCMSARLGINSARDCISFVPVFLLFWLLNGITWANHKYLISMGKIVKRRPRGERDFIVNSNCKTMPFD